MMRLSLAEPQSFVAPQTVSGLLVVKTRGDTQCMDAGLVDDAPSGVHRTGGAVAAPVVTKREEPLFPESARRAMTRGSTAITLESRISKTGCVRDIRLVKQSQWPELNGAAVLALAKWKFKPGTLDGVPVDVIFQLTINFRL
jgi:protein TonB